MEIYVLTENEAGKPIYAIDYVTKDADEYVELTIVFDDWAIVGNYLITYFDWEETGRFKINEIDNIGILGLTANN